MVRPRAKAYNGSRRGRPDGKTGEILLVIPDDSAGSRAVVFVQPRPDGGHPSDPEPADANCRHNLAAIF
jgi:hypothetical protein